MYNRLIGGDCLFGFGSQEANLGRDGFSKDFARAAGLWDRLSVQSRFGGALVGGPGYATLLGCESEKFGKQSVVAFGGMGVKKGVHAGTIDGRGMVRQCKRALATPGPTPGLCPDPLLQGREGAAAGRLAAGRSRL